MQSQVLDRGKRLYIYFFLLSWILLSLFTGCVSQICDQEAELVSPALMKQLVHGHAIPKGQMNAGFFEQDIEAEDIAMCLLSCCEKPLCNVAWFTHEKCFTIECNESDPSACDPAEQSGSNYNDTVLITVRSVELTKATDECSIFSKKLPCGENEECVNNENHVKRCRCVDGYIWKNTHSKQCVPAPENASEAANAPKMAGLSMVSDECQVGVTDCGKHKQCIQWGSKSDTGLCDCALGYMKDSSDKCVFIRDCEFGVTHCGVNRACVLENSRSKFGTCNCIAGYTENNDQDCVLIENEEKKDETTSTKSVTTGPEVTVIPQVTVTAEMKETPKAGQTPLPETTTLKVQVLTVSAGENKEIQLPQNEVTLNAFALPEPPPGEEYHYDWTMAAHPEADEYGAMEGRNTNTLKLKQLVSGLYTFNIQVTGNNRFGEAEVNVTVKPPARQNKPPVAVIKPAQTTLKLPNTSILDGSGSTDDDRIVAYHWDVVSGPLQDKSVTGESPILKLSDLAPGNYTFKLTVTDSDGATNSTTASVMVIKETDYPPKANAGSDVVIHLPQNFVILYGNLSTDDKGIVSYEWIKASGDTLAADMQGTRTPELHLSNLEVGDYTFTLKVTDAAGQISTADVHVYVKPEENTPPVAVTAGSIETSLPLDSILLDGSNSTDDQKITSYLWQQTKGPTVLTIEDADKEQASATGDIKVGKYSFRLTVKDKEDLMSSATLDVDVKQVQNEPPIARAGGDLTVQLPQMLVTLDGSRSSDDHKIMEYHWVRDPKSLSAGDVLNSSDHQAVLQLVNLVAGKYIFTLTVVDAEGFSSSDQASVTVKATNHKLDLMELTLEADISQFTEENKKNLQNQLALLLPKNPAQGDTRIYIESITEDSCSGNLRILFYAMNVMRDQKVYRSGKETLQVLKQKLMSSPYVLEFRAVSIDTLVCQNNCSNHGHCDLRTKLCVCEAFWTQDVFLYWIHGESNCDWSILYVVIVCFLIVISCTGAVWACFCCWQRKRCSCRRCKYQSKKKHRYALLSNEDDEGEAIPMKKNSKGKNQNSSVMISDSEFTSDEETLFVNQKKTNGHLATLNGISKQHLKPSLMT